MITSSQTQQFDLAGINHFHLDNRLIYRAKLNDTYYSLLLVDSGAQRSIKSRKLSQRLGGLCTKSKVQISGFDGKTSSTLGTIKFKLNMLGTKNSIDIKALVVENCNPAIILGVDDIKRLGFTMTDPRGQECFACEMHQTVYKMKQNDNILLGDNDCQLRMKENCNYYNAEISSNCKNCNLNNKMNNDQSCNIENSHSNSLECSDYYNYCNIEFRENCDCNIDDKLENYTCCKLEYKNKDSLGLDDNCDNCNLCNYCNCDLQSRQDSCNTCCVNCNTCNCNFNHGMDPMKANADNCNSCKIRLAELCKYCKSNQTLNNNCDKCRMQAKHKSEDCIENESLEYVDVCYAKEILELDSNVYGIYTWSQVPGLVTPLTYDFDFPEGIISTGSNLLIGRSNLSARELLHKPVARIKSIDTAHKIKLISQNEIDNCPSAFGVLTVNNEGNIKIKDYKQSRDLSFNCNTNSKMKRQEELICTATPALNCLSPAEKNIVLAWLRDYDQTFALDHDDLGYTDLEKLDIDTGTHEPLYSRPYNMHLIYRQAVEDQVQELFKKGLIRESRSPWNSPALLVKKKLPDSGKTGVRLVIDYRGLNKITTRSSLFS